MTQPAPESYEQEVRQALPAFFHPVEVIDRVPTTMTRAAELAVAGAPEGTMVVADEQTAGRGRLARGWSAARGTSLLVSVVLRPPLPHQRAWLVSAAAGVALADAVATLLPASVPVGLKWPNDLELAGRKAAGLLVEAFAAPGGGLDAVVLGMGVNVSQRADDFDPALGGRATSVALAAAGPAPAGTPQPRIRRGELLAAWAPRFLDHYRPLAAGEHAPVLSAYHDHLATLGRRVRAERLDATPLTGTATDVTPDGALVVETPTGHREAVLAADVHHLRLAAQR